MIRRKLVNKIQVIVFSPICLFSTFAFGLSDNFNDNLRGSYWTLLEDSHDKLRLDEQNQRLEIIANNPLSSSTDAIYLSNGSNGFKISTSKDFQLLIDYSFVGVETLGVSTPISLVLGVGRDLEGTDSAAIGVALAKVFGISTLSTIAAYRTDDVQHGALIGLAPQSSSMFVSYDASEDDLLLGLTIGNYMTLHGIVAGQWNADSLWVSFGARGSGHTLVSGNASLDNFRIAAGDVNPIPEPATLFLFGSGVAGLATVGRRKKRTSLPEPAAVMILKMDVP